MTQVDRSQKRRKIHDPGSSECIGENQYMDWVRMHKVRVDDGHVCDYRGRLVLCSSSLVLVPTHVYIYIYLPVLLQL